MVQIRGVVRRGVCVFGLVGAMAAHASVSPPPATWPVGNPVNGKPLYQTSCLNCHSGLTNATDSLGKVGNAINRPAVTNNAILKGVMTNAALRALTAQQLADISAYLGNPNATASAVMAAATPSTLVFAATNVGATSAAQAVKLSNSGTAPLGPITFSATGSFSVAPGTCVAGGSLAAAASCTVQVSFKPAAAGPSAGSVVFNHNASPATSSVALSGTGVAATPVASVTPTALSFSQLVGASSANQTVMVANTGTAPLALSGITFTGAQATEFSKASASTCGTSVAAGASCTVLVSFKPTVVGVRTGVLNVAHNASAAATTVALNGIATATAQPVASVNQNALTFASQAVGSKTSQTVTLTNTGSAALALSSIKVSGANASEYTLGGTCAAALSLAAGQSCTMAVQFLPTALGTRTASVLLSSNAYAVTISLSGVATPAPAPAVSLAPTAQDFSVATVGAAPVSRNVVLSNTGAAALSLSSVVVTGAGFSGGHNCGASVAPGASCTVTMAFAPSGAGAATGTLTVVSNAPTSPSVVALSGTGSLTAVPVLAWSVTGPLPAFADTAVGATSAALSLNLLNQGPGPVTLSGVASSSGEFALGGNCAAGTVLAANSSCAATVVFAPAQVGPRSAVLSVASNGSNPAQGLMAGNGVLSAQHALAVSVPSVVVPTHMLGSPSDPVFLTVTNSGTSPISLTELKYVGAVFAAEIVGRDLPVLLAPGETTDLEVELDQSRTDMAGEFSDVLTIVTSDPSVTQTVAVQASVQTSPVEAAMPTSNKGGGGCSVLSGDTGAADPVLWLLVALAAGALWLRKRQAKRGA
jgi:trimeric autotransporter adhesin